jgi:hypothetical protein
MDGSLSVRFRWRTTKRALGSKPWLSTYREAVDSPRDRRCGTIVATFSWTTPSIVVSSLPTYSSREKAHTQVVPSTLLWYIEAALCAQVTRKVVEDIDVHVDTITFLQRRSMLGKK